MPCVGPDPISLQLSGYRNSITNTLELLRGYFATRWSCACRSSSVWVMGTGDHHRSAGGSRGYVVRQQTTMARGGKQGCGRRGAVASSEEATYVVPSSTWVCAVDGHARVNILEEHHYGGCRWGIDVWCIHSKLFNVETGP